MQITNNSDRVVSLGGSVKLAPGATAPVASDARWLVKTPLCKAYIADGTLTVDQHQKLDAKAAKASDKTKLTA